MYTAQGLQRCDGSQQASGSLCCRVDVGLVSGLTRDLILLNVLALVEMEMIWVLMVVDAQAVRMLASHILGVALFSGKFGHVEAETLLSIYFKSYFLQECTRLLSIYLEEALPGAVYPQEHETLSDSYSNKLFFSAQDIAIAGYIADTIDSDL